MPTDLVRVSKFLSLILRHRPERIGLSLDEHGWANVDDLIRLANDQSVPLSRLVLEQVVTENDKQRFAFSEDGRWIRASQGHSLEVDLGLPASEPPATLYHGTAARFLASIRAEGISAGRRQYVHLSTVPAIATKVGQRHGKPVVLTIRAREMSAAGHPFYLSANGIWLTRRVPPEFVGVPSPYAVGRRAR